MRGLLGSRGSRSVAVMVKAVERCAVDCGLLARNRLVLSPCARQLPTGKNSCEIDTILSLWDAGRGEVYGSIRRIEVISIHFLCQHSAAVELKL